MDTADWRLIVDVLGAGNLPLIPLGDWFDMCAMHHPACMYPGCVEDDFGDGLTGIELHDVEDRPVVFCSAHILYSGGEPVEYSSMDDARRPQSEELEDYYRHTAVQQPLSKPECEKGILSVLKGEHEPRGGRILSAKALEGCLTRGRHGVGRVRERDTRQLLKRSRKMRCNKKVFYQPECEYPGCDSVFEGDSFNWWPDTEWVVDEMQDKDWVLLRDKDGEWHAFCDGHVKRDSDRAVYFDERDESRQPRKHGLLEYYLEEPDTPLVRPECETGVLSALDAGLVGSDGLSVDGVEVVDRIIGVCRERRRLALADSSFVSDGYRQGRVSAYNDVIRACERLDGVDSAGVVATSCILCYVKTSTQNDIGETHGTCRAIRNQHR